jgi:O-methyltransferase
MTELAGNSRSMLDDVARLRALYLDAMERILCNTIYRDEHWVPSGGAEPYDPDRRAIGLDWPSQALTMIGSARLRHLRSCVEAVLNENVPGDLIEAGVWRGGASIMMRAVLEAYGVTERCVWLADSFRGLPAPNPDRYPLDAVMHFEGFPELAVSLEAVKENFRRFDLLDGSVRFVEGWFSDTLAHVGAERFALLRLDGDLYESTTNALDALYPKLSPGGFVVIDDYGAFEACRAAVHDYRARHGISDEIDTIDWTGVYWRKG